MLKYFYGDDSYAAREEIKGLAEKQKAQIEWLASDTLTPQEVTVRLAQGGDSLFGKKMLVVREASRLPAAVQERLVAPANDSGVVAWDEGQPDRRSLVYRTWKDQAREFSAPAEIELIAWLQQEAKRREVTLEDAAGRAMVERLRSDRWRLLSELERLSLVHTEITLDTVEQEVDAQAEGGEVFELLAALVRGERQETIKQLKGLLESGESEFYVLSMLAYQFRMLYLVARGQTGGLKAGVVRRSSAVARQRPAAAWLENLTRVVATDFAIKQGKTDPRTGVTMLVLGLMTTPTPVSK